MIEQLLVGGLLSLLASFNVFAKLTPEELTAKAQGIAHYGQSAWSSAKPFLKVAAEAGDAKAQYYLGEAIRLSNVYMTADAKKWYEAAAEQGHLYAMLRLSSDDDLCKVIGTCNGKSGEDWRTQTLKTARERAGEGDTEAMMVLYIAEQGLAWLEKAAEAGDSYAQNFLAIAYEKGAGWFFSPTGRDKAIEHWYRASTEGGYPRGMVNYADLLYKKNKGKAEVGYWIKKLQKLDISMFLEATHSMSPTSRTVTVIPATWLRPTQ